MPRQPMQAAHILPSASPRLFKLLHLRLVAILTWQRSRDIRTAVAAPAAEHAVGAVCVHPVHHIDQCAAIRVLLLFPGQRILC